ncbi:MAG: SbcC/MukB-like Walker B domain-containing protein [Pseudomonadota bacterium]
MHLKKFIYVNWGNVPNSEFEFGSINLFSGGNGSGKTTAADAVQTIMTAAHENLFHFNPGQDESSQRGRGGKQVRTLPSYVLGCDDGSYARPHACDGYLAAYFIPDQHEQAEPFTALIGMRASLETAGSQKIARLDEIQFYILPNIELALSDLIKDDKGNRTIANLEKIYANLRRQFGKEAVEKYDKKKDYLARLYGALRGKKDAVNQREAMNAARAFSRFMAYKPIKGIDEFVATEVLEHRDLGEAIRNVSAMLKRIYTMDADAKQLREAIARMAQGRDTADSFISNWVEQQVLLYSLAKRRYKDCQKDYLKEKQRQQLLRENVVIAEQKMGLCEQRRTDLTQQIIDVNTRRMGIPALRDKDQLLGDKQSLEKNIHSTVPNLLLQAQQLEHNFHAATHILQALRKTSITLELPALDDKFLQKNMQRVVDEYEVIELQALLNRDWVDISPLEQKLDKAVELQQLHNQFAATWFATPIENKNSLRDQLAQEATRRLQLVERLQKNINHKQNEIQALDINKVTYPGFVRSALDVLQQHCPQADARVLCDYVDIADRDWQSAIEGYIGAARFGIIVSEEHEAEAIRLVRGMSGSGKSARIIQGEKARRDMEKIASVPANSITHLMRFSHATAEYYLKASYGNVERVSDANSLRNSRRGLTKEAMGSGNYAMFRCDIADSDLVFGREARERARHEKQHELDALRKEWQQATDHANEGQQLLRSIDKVKPVSYADHLQTMLDAQRRVQTIEYKLQQLDLTDSQALDLELEKLKLSEKELTQEFASLNNERIENAATLKNVDDKCKELNVVQEKTQTAAEQTEDNVRSITALWPEFDPELRLDQADSDSQQHDLGYFETHVKAVSTEIKIYLHRLQQAVLQHNLYCKTADGVLLNIDQADDFSKNNFSEICELRRQFDKFYNRDKNHILAQRQQEIEALRLSFNNAFVTNLCHSIYQAINDGKKILEELNNELKHHRFGADRESFRFDWEWVPEFKEYWQFFKAVIDNPSLGDGETLFDMQLDPKHEQIRERIMTMLLDEDEHKALRDLTRIADYRNYRRYEIYKEPEGKAPIPLSQYGTGSGGQLETPAYIIRSAAITSAFRFNEGHNHLRMVLVDEAFSKMDEHRSREVINYLTESLGLQLLFIMPSSKSGPFMDLISHQFVFSKCPTAEPVGELKSRVVLDRQVCNPEKIQQLMELHRTTVRYQSSLDFMQEVEEQ